MRQELSASHAAGQEMLSRNEGLQSINEELTTLNDELSNRNLEMTPNRAKPVSPRK